VTTRDEAQSFDRLAERYDRLSELGGDVVGDWLPEVMPASGGRALDLGCGAGRHAVVLAERFAQVDAIDLSGSMIRLARRKRPRSNITYLEANLLDIDGQYDFILSAMTLHHVADLPATLRRLEKTVAPGGRAALVDTVSRRPSTPRWWLYCGELRKLARNLRQRGLSEAWEIYRLSTGEWLDHRASDRYLSREQFEQTYAQTFPAARFSRVGRAHGMLWDNLS
jgi:ubiquinone/menaquinone biosynthesis C-methylase UbiE